MVLRESVIDLLAIFTASTYLKQAVTGTAERKVVPSWAKGGFFRGKRKPDELLAGAQQKMTEFNFCLRMNLKIPLKEP